jgi:hypothetical protein
VSAFQDTDHKWRRKKAKEGDIFKHFHVKKSFM